MRGAVILEGCGCKNFRALRTHPPHLNSRYATGICDTLMLSIPITCSNEFCAFVCVCVCIHACTMAIIVTNMCPYMHVMTLKPYSWFVSSIH